MGYERLITPADTVVDDSDYIFSKASAQGRFYHLTFAVIVLVLYLTYPAIWNPY